MKNDDFIDENDSLCYKMMNRGDLAATSTPSEVMSIVSYR